MFTIGEFSRLCCISARMLRHYDHMGLLHPKEIDTFTRYRYYDSSQLSAVHKIEKLKRYGFTLSQIRTLLPLPENELNQKLAGQYESMIQKIQLQKHILRQMEADLYPNQNQEDFIMSENNYDVIILENPPQRVLGLKRTIDITYGDIHQLLSDLKADMKLKGLKQSGPFQMVYLSEEFSHENMEVEAQVQVAGAHEAVKELEACTYVATTHKGPMKHVHKAYDKICCWLDEHPEYHLSGPSMERYIQSEQMVSSREELVTGVLFPVTMD